VSEGTDLGFTTAAGGRSLTTARFGPDNRLDPLTPLRVRNTLLDGSRRCVQVRLTSVDATQPAARRLLDAEVSTALRLHRAFAGTEYAPLFPGTIGYDLDAAEPFVLYEPPRGRPATEYHGVSVTGQRVIARDLLLALTLLEHQDLVHRGVNPATVRWDGQAVQLWGLDTVVRSGQPRTPWGRAPYAAPEQRRGQGPADPRDAVWSCAQVLYELATGRPGPADRAPADLSTHRVLAETLHRAFAPTAEQRPHPSELLDVLAPGSSHQVELTAAGDELEPHRAAYEKALAVRQEFGPEPADKAPPPSDPDTPVPVLCPFCLNHVSFDINALFSTDSRQQLKPLDLSRISNPKRVADEIRTAFQLCQADQDFGPHYIPAPYLVNGRPLTVAMVGQSSTGKSHLLTQMIAEITEDGLEPYGLKWQSVNPQQHSAFVRDRVAPLRNGRVLEHTPLLGQDEYANFVESLLITDRRGRIRPVAFFDLGGEDLTRTDALLRFLLGVDAMIFVVDPTLALPLPALDDLRTALGVEVNRDGDSAFDTVLDRLPRSGPYLDVAAAMVLGKSDLLRFEPPVDRWLNEPRRAPTDPDRSREESRDVYALLRRHAGKAWLRPFDSVRHCSLHVASATGGREQQGRYPRGVQAQRVLEPLIAVLTTLELIEAPAGTGGVGG